MRSFSLAVALPLAFGACQLDPRHQAVETVAQNWVAAAAQDDSARVSELSTGEQPWRAARYVRWLRPDFLAAASRGGNVGWSPSFQGDRALLGMRVPYRDGEEQLHFALTRRADGWVVSRVDVRFEGTQPGDPETQPNFVELRKQHGFEMVSQR